MQMSEPRLFQHQVSKTNSLKILFRILSNCCKVLLHKRTIAINIFLTRDQEVQQVSEFTRWAHQIKIHLQPTKWSFFQTRRSSAKSWSCCTSSNSTSTCATSWPSTTQTSSRLTSPVYTISQCNHFRATFLQRKRYTVSFSCASMVIGSKYCTKCTSWKSLESHELKRWFRTSSSPKSMKVCIFRAIFWPFRESWGAKPRKIARKSKRNTRRMRRSKMKSRCLDWIDSSLIRGLKAHCLLFLIKLTLLVKLMKALLKISLKASHFAKIKIKASLSKESMRNSWYSWSKYATSFWHKVCHAPMKRSSLCLQITRSKRYPPHSKQSTNKCLFITCLVTPTSNSFLEW